MDLKKMMTFLGMLVGALMLMSASCNKDESDDPGGSCTGYVSATASGELNATLCMEALVSYDYVDGESLSFITRQDGEPIYSCTIQLRSYAGPITGVGTYNCGLDEVGYVELDIHGTDNEFYKAQSGTLTVTQLDATNFQATFNIVAKGYYNGKTLNLSGTAGI
jgi:hypothetical protein